MSKSSTATGNDTFFYGCFSSVDGVFQAELAVFHFSFGSSTNFNYSDTTNEFSKTLLQLLTVVVRRGVLDFAADLLNARFDIGFGASAINDTLTPLNRALFLEANPIPVKWALQQQGLIGGGIRLPLTPLDEQFHAEVTAALQAAGV